MRSWLPSAHVEARCPLGACEDCRPVSLVSSPLAHPFPTNSCGGEAREEGPLAHRIAVSDRIKCGRGRGVEGLEGKASPSTECAAAVKVIWRPRVH